MEGYKAGADWLVTALITRPADERIVRASATQIRWDVAWREWLVANQARLLPWREIYLGRRLSVAEEAERSEELLFEVLRHGLENHDSNKESVETHLTGILNARQRVLSLCREEKLDESFSGLPALFGITIFGSNLAELHAAANHVETAACGVSGIGNVVNNTKIPVDTLRVEIDRAACAV